MYTVVKSLYIPTFMLKDWIKDTFTPHSLLPPNQVLVSYLDYHHTGNIDRPIYGLSPQKEKVKRKNDKTQNEILILLFNCLVGSRRKESNHQVNATFNWQIFYKNILHCVLVNSFMKNTSRTLDRFYSIFFLSCKSWRTTILVFDGDKQSTLSF